MSGSEVRQNGERAFDQLDGAPMPSALVRYHSEEVQGVGVIRRLLQHLAVKGLSPIPPSRLVMGEGGLKIAQGLLPPGGIFVVW